MDKEKKKPSGEEKRRLYVLAFCIAAGIEVFRYAFGTGSFQPTMIGLAIMIAAVLYFAYSWITERFRS